MSGNRESSSMSLSSEGEMTKAALPIIVIIGLLLGAAFILPLALNISGTSSNSPSNESEIAAMITRTAESYGLSLCTSTPVAVSYPGMTDAMLYHYGLACGAYLTGDNLEVLIIAFVSQEDRQAAAGKLKAQLAEDQAQGIVLVETGNYLIAMKGPASQSIQNRILVQPTNASTGIP
jgi:hypothetical protein